MMNILLIVLLLTPLAVFSEERNLISGTEANDSLNGTTLADEIYGGQGEDVIYGGEGLDLLYGGEGADTFVVNISDSTLDTVMDFNPEEGDSVLFNIDASRSKLNIPKQLGSKNIKIDSKGNVKILLINNKSRNVINLKKSKFYFKVEDQGKYVRLVFKKTL
jgi:triacylglycerol lipase